MSVQIEDKISSEEEYEQVRMTLSEKKKPSYLMRRLMNTMESYRQSKKYGWSRPWNKYDLINFQSFKLNWVNDDFLLDQMTDVLEEQFASMPNDIQDYCRAMIVNKEALMGFIFTHDFSDKGRLYEGITLSLGRVSKKRFRDRLDVILESPIVEGKSQGLRRVRLYVDPYRVGIKEPMYQDTNEIIVEASSKLFSTLTDLSWSWSNDHSRLWNHWVMNYVDYFGERNWALESSFFPYVGGKVSRIVIDKKDSITVDQL